MDVPLWRRIAGQVTPAMTIGVSTKYSRSALAMHLSPFHRMRTPGARSKTLRAPSGWNSRLPKTGSCRASSYVSDVNELGHPRVSVA